MARDMRPVAFSGVGYERERDEDGHGAAVATQDHATLTNGTRLGTTEESATGTYQLGMRASGRTVL